MLIKGNSKKTADNVSEIKLLNRFKRLTNEYYSNERGIKFYASKLSVSTSYLHKIAKRQLNTTPAVFINSVVLRQARFLLTIPKYNISEIAYELSFSDIHSFSKYFKKHTGISPTQYRLKRTTQELYRNGQEIPHLDNS